MDHLSHHTRPHIHLAPADQADMACRLRSLVMASEMFLSWNCLHPQYDYVADDVFLSYASLLWLPSVFLWYSPW